MFYLLATVLVLFIVAFILFLIFLRKMDHATFKKFCEKKIRRFAKRNKLLAIENLNLLNYQREKVDIDHVIFGKKYIYLVTDILLKGFVKGETNDNSWVHLNTTTKKSHYISNLNKFSEQNIQEFSGIFGIKPDFIVAICLVPNECDFSIKSIEKSNNLVAHYASLTKRIKELEKQDIGSLNEEQIYEQYKAVKERNE